MIGRALSSLIPTCDNARTPLGKAAIHGATVGLYILMLLYHGKSALIHLGHWLKGAR